MPVELHQLTPANAGQLSYSVAKELARQTSAQFGAVRGSKIGISLASCCAAVAVNKGYWGATKNLTGYGDVPDFNFRERNGNQARGRLPIAAFRDALPYGIVFGNSRIAAGQMDQGNLAGHAERCALTAARGTELYDITRINGRKRGRTEEAVLFVELHPCGDDDNSGCRGWLGGASGGGVENPYNNIINGQGTTILHVWWRWTYPNGDGFAQMVDFHRQNLLIQLAQINNSW